MGKPTERHSPSGRNGPAQGHDRMERTTGFEPATLTLAKEMGTVRPARSCPLSRLRSADLSAQPAESAPVRLG